ncbi:unnamed protein product [Caenorhabditis sp. 36 PRJEB53466]|nr:unnamed protein product [Caenorhabditis sp. 36 PRJEB53466]
MKILFPLFSLLVVLVASVATCDWDIPGDLCNYDYRIDLTPENDDRLHKKLAKVEEEPDFDGYFDAEQLEDPKNRQFFGVIVRFFKTLLKLGAKTTRTVVKTGAKGLVRIRRVASNRKWTGKSFPKEQKLIGKSAQVVERDSEGKDTWHKVYQFAETEQGSGLLYSIRDVVTGNVDEGFETMAVNPLDQWDEVN